MKVVAVDYGSARTGVAASDPTGTLARPVGVVEGVRTESGLEQLVELIRTESPERVVVGMPLTLAGERGEQARETERFLDELRNALDVPVEHFDERFTTDLAEQDLGSRNLPADARAAAHLLTSYLAWSSRSAE
jgi:putative Holliday junction resolvase